MGFWNRGMSEEGIWEGLVIVRSRCRREDKVVGGLVVRWVRRVRDCWINLVSASMSGKVKEREMG